MNEKSQLTSAEIGNLWTQYLSDSLAICMNKYFLAKVEDEEIKPFLKMALQLSEKHLTQIAHFFTNENFPVPQGFSVNDVNLDAPRLFTDVFSLHYNTTMTIHGLSCYSLALTTSTRKDVRDFYDECIDSVKKLYNLGTDVLLSKGVFYRPPYIYPEKVEYVQRAGLFDDWLSKNRPLHAMEINNLVFNMQKNLMARTLDIGFSQTAKSKEVRQALAKSADLSQKHCDIFSQLLHKDNLGAPPEWDSHVTNSTVPPFSDKLMMNLSQNLYTAAIGYYGAALATSMRTDLAKSYTKMIAEVMLAAEDMMNGA